MQSEPPPPTNPPPLHPVRPVTKRARKAVNCEPCRMSKLKCDRNRPCSSCVLRNTTHLCYQNGPRPDSADHRPPDDPTAGVDLRREIAKIRNSLTLLESFVNRNSPWYSLPDQSFKQEAIDHSLGATSATDFAPGMLAQPRTGDGGMYAGPTSAATHFATVNAAESDITDDDDDDRSILSDAPGSPSPRDFDLLAMLPEITLVDELLKHYFESCQWENRHLHHASFMHAWAKFKTNAHHDRLTLATVFVVLAIAVNFLPARHPLLESFSEPPAELSENYYTLGCTALTRYHAERRTYSLELIELLLLRTHYLTITKDQCEDLWSIRSELVSTAIAMGLHRDPRGWKMSREQAERRRWAWWNIMLIERWQAFMFGRPLSICNHHFDTQFPSAFDQAYDPSGRLHLPYLHLFRLAEAMGDIMDDAVSVRPVPYERVISQDQVLARWLDTLPAELNLDDYRLARALSSKELPTRRTGAQSLCIRIFYHHVRFTLHRPYAGPWKASPSSQTIMHQPPDPRWQQSLETAITCADKLTQLVAQARPDFLANDWLAVPGHLHWGPFHIFSAAMFFSFQLIANPDQPGGNLFRANIKRVMVVMEHLRGIHVADKAYSVLKALAPLYDDVGNAPEDKEERERKKSRVLSFVRRLAFPCHDSPAYTRMKVHGGAVAEVVVNGAVVHHGGSHVMVASPGSGGSMSSPGNMPVTPVAGPVGLPAGSHPPPLPQGALGASQVQQQQQQGQPVAGPSGQQAQAYSVSPSAQSQQPPPQTQAHPGQAIPVSQARTSLYESHPHAGPSHHPPPPPPPQHHQPPHPHAPPPPPSHPHSQPHAGPSSHHIQPSHSETGPGPGYVTDETVWGNSIGLDSAEWARFVDVLQPQSRGVPQPPHGHGHALGVQMHPGMAGHGHGHGPVHVMGPVGPGRTGDAMV